MRVDAINHVSQLYKPANAKKTDRAGEVGKKDAYEISQSAKDYQVAKKAVAEADDIREDKVAELKEALASGAYNVSSQEIAEKIVSSYFDFQI
ncbi:flagellar biosynthesis anti-sigma factor FlgM [bacterium 1xD8-6]|nr:flagellar biosynthesis anti-sigma factor FlgM [bacterium D16-36]RKI73238.1 flagellar biosynthesis anti-sigma factor FlgM [bacterium 1xD8-6]